MEKISNKINEIRTLIAEIEILDAINRTITLAESLELPHLRDEALLLKVSQTKIKNDTQKNIDDADDLEVRQNRVIDQILNLLTRMELLIKQKVEKNQTIPVSPIKDNTGKNVTINKTITTNSTKSEDSNNTALIAIIVVVTLVIVGFLLTKIIGNKTVTTTEQELPEVSTIAQCKDYVERIEAAIEAKEFEKAKKGLIAADEVCENKLQLQFLLEDYNTALLEATQNENNDVEVPSENNTENDTNNDSNEETTPNRDVKPEIIKPGIVQINPEILNINPNLIIKPELLHLDLWTGTWNSSFGKVAFVQVGTEIFGDYENGKGWLQGKYDTKTNLLSGTFYNSLSKRAGNFQFKKNGKQFEGKWGWKGAALSGKWSGTLDNSSTPTLQYYKTGFKGRVLNESSRPVSRAKVMVNGKSAVFTNHKGVFQIPLPQGSYTIVVSHANYQSQKLPKTFYLKDTQENILIKLKKK